MTLRMSSSRSNSSNNSDRPPLYRASAMKGDDLGTEEGENTLIGNLEAQANKSSRNADGFRPAVPGERVPLGIMSLGPALTEGTRGTENPALRRQSFKDIAKRVQIMQRVAQFKKQASSRSLEEKKETRGHKRVKTLLESINESPSANFDANGFVTGVGVDPFDSNRDAGDFHGLNALWSEELSTSSEEEEVGIESEGSLIVSQKQKHSNSSEGLPLLSDAESGRADYEAINKRLMLARRSKIEKQWQRAKKCLNPINWIYLLLDLFLHSTLVLAFPLFVVALILFYGCGNPGLDFLPGTATLSWWFNFLGRQLVLLELARLIQFVLIDCFILSSKIVVHMLGPLITIFFLQFKGWPFISTSWGILAMLLLQGNNPFQKHWLYFTRIQIYSSADSGVYIISSNVYLRILVGMILAGLVTAVKRTLVTLYFGKRTFEVYKPKLEEILTDIIVISELAELGAEADNLPDDGNSMDTNDLVEASIKRRGQLAPVRWSSLRFKKEPRQRLDSDADASVGLDKNFSGDISNEMAGNNIEMTSNSDEDGKRALLRRKASLSRLSSSGKLRIKNLLDRWDEPVNKLDKRHDSTVKDILNFRRALTYMDMTHPFSEAFGPASTRDELIKSAQKLYHRLLKLAPGSTVLPYSVLVALADEEDGTQDKDKRNAIRNLFRPDAEKEIPILTFVQSCDYVYKRLRYFRASVGNASVIDKVLENIIDAIYGFGLALLILALLNLNPWPLLVSMSTLLVTFAFAIGPTAAKAIEGIILIVGRRPFDIGDRIIIADTPGGAVPGVANSWFVEDITLFHTTLRFAANNEVATISNGSIAASRITNCARSKHACCHVLLKLHIHIHEGGNVALFREALENYVQDNPSVWESIVLFRCEDIDTDSEFVIYRLAIRSQHPWQVSGRVLQDRAQLHQFCVEVAKRLDVAFDSPSPRRVLYYGGRLVDGAVKDYKKDLLQNAQNITKNRDLGDWLQTWSEDERQERANLSGSISRNKSEIHRPAFADSSGADPLDNYDISVAANNKFLEMVQESNG